MKSGTQQPLYISKCFSCSAEQRCPPDGPTQQGSAGPVEALFRLIEYPFKEIANLPYFTARKAGIIRSEDCIRGSQ